MFFKTPLFQPIRASAALALLLAFPIRGTAAPKEVKVNVPVGEGAKPVMVQTGQTSAPGTAKTVIPTLTGGGLPVVDPAVVEPGIGAPAEAAKVQAAAKSAPGASPIDIAAPAGVPRDKIRVVPKAAPSKSAGAAAPELKVGDKRFQRGIRRVQDGTSEMGAAMAEKEGASAEGVVKASLLGGIMFDGAGKRAPGNFADGPANGGNFGRGPPRRSNLERAGPSDEQFLRAFVTERIPDADESGKEGVEFDEAAVARRVDELAALGRRMEAVLQERYGLERGEARDLWRELLKEHPTVFGYHIPEHSHQPLMVTNRVLDRIESLGGARDEIRRENLREWNAAHAEYDRFNTKPMPQKYDGNRDAPRISKAAQIRRVESELADAGPAAVHLEWMQKALAELKFERLQLLTKLTQAEVMKSLLEEEVTREDRAILDIATILHDVDPTREEGTLARVAYTVEWLDTPRGEEILSRLAKGRFPNANAAELASIREKVKAYIMATDFQYEGAKKAAIWPSFLAQMAKAWGIDLKSAWNVNDPSEIPSDDPFATGDPTARKVLALAHLLRISDQFGAYTNAASLTPDDRGEQFRFTDWMVRMLKREMRRTPFVPEFLQGLPADGLLAGTFNFLTQREPGSPTFDDKVEGAAKPISVAGITEQVLDTARNFRSAYAPEKFKPSDFWASPEDAERFLLSPRGRVPSWFQVGRRPERADRQRFYDDLVSAYLMTRPDGLYRTNRAQVIEMLEDHGVEIDWEGAPPKEAPKDTPDAGAAPTKSGVTSRAPPGRPSDDAGRAIQATKRYIASIAGGLKIDDRQRYALMEMGLEEQGIKLDSPVGRAVEAELFPNRARRGAAARSAISAQFNDHAALIVELAEKFAKTTQEVEAVIKSHPELARILSGRVPEQQARTQLVYALHRERVERLTAAYPDNPQGNFLRAMAQEILTPGGKSIEEIVRAGAFAYVSFQGTRVDSTSVGRDPDVQTSDYVFYVLLEPSGQWTINGYRKNNQSLSGGDRKYIEALQNWLKAGLRDGVQFSPRPV
jgi:hypothetical protein